MKEEVQMKRQKVLLQKREDGTACQKLNVTTQLPKATMKPSPDHSLAPRPHSHQKLHPH